MIDSSGAANPGNQIFTGTAQPVFINPGQIIQLTYGSGLFAGAGGWQIVGSPVFGPAGATNQIQFNSGASPAFTGDPNLTWQSSTSNLLIAGANGAINSEVILQDNTNTTRCLIGVAGQNAGIIAETLQFDTVILANGQSILLSTNDAFVPAVEITDEGAVGFNFRLVVQNGGGLATLAGGTGAGVGPTLNFLNSPNDIASTFQVIAGVGPAAGASTILTFTFAVARVASPEAVMILPANENAANLVLTGTNVYADNLLAASFDLVLTGNALIQGNAYNFYYMII